MGNVEKAILISFMAASALSSDISGRGQIATQPKSKYEAIAKTEGIEQDPPTQEPPSDN